ncbi:MAG: hypothetical protein JW388_0278 [Nitrospira sp.]|nr:hypothetical protein [Nitrospira sp.]
MSLRDRAISAELKTGSVEVPQWGGTVGVREMTVSQRVVFAELWSKSQARALVQLLIDNTFDPDTGKAIFERTDRDVLAEKGGKAVQICTDKIFSISGYTADAAEDMEKNSKASAD